MRIAVTGGGTGGHIYPALEVARLAQERGCEILYLGSIRGQEGEICRQRGILFEGFPSEPLYSMRTARGWKALSGLLRSIGMAKRALKAASPDAVFSTGGYSAAPVMAAARSLGVRYSIHESNSVPGRSNRMFAPSATRFTSTFYATAEHVPNALHTGQPIRRELRDAVASRVDSGNQVVVLGGSQGSVFLNETVPKAIALLSESISVIHAAGRGNFATVVGQAPTRSNYKIVPYLETPEIVQAYLTSSVAVARSGGTVAEFALFGLPSVLVPLPTSADDHQRENAQELARIGGATLIDQADADPAKLAEAIEGWLSNRERRESACASLQSWAVPDATERIVELLLEPNRTIHA